MPSVRPPPSTYPAIGTPTLELLNDLDKPNPGNQEELEANKDRIGNAGPLWHQHRIKGHIGPTVTLYEIVPRRRGTHQ
jgi:DNA segregation ATPase FtsK/SpoIIIE-like protein